MARVTTRESKDASARVALGQALRMMKAKDVGLTYAVIAERSDLPKSTLVRYFLGERDITVTKLGALCEALGATIGEVLALADQLQVEQESTAGKS